MPMARRKRDWEKNTIIYIRCNERVKRAWKKYVANFDNSEEALIDLLRRVGYWPERGEVY